VAALISSRKPKPRKRQRSALVGAEKDLAIHERRKPDARVAARASRAHSAFFDTNVLLYCDDSANPEKQQKALDLVVEHRREDTGVVSLQVLQEYFVSVTRKFGLDPGLAREKVEVYSRFRVAETAITDVLAAIDLHRLHGFSFWDALVIRCAQQSGCRVLLTEDMQHGQIVNGVRIVNPFI